MTNRNHPEAAALPETKPTSLRKTFADQQAVKAAARAEEMSDTALTGLWVAVNMEYERRHGYNPDLAGAVSEMIELAAAHERLVPLVADSAGIGSPALQSLKVSVRESWQLIGDLINQYDTAPVSYSALVVDCDSWWHELERMAVMNLDPRLVSAFLVERAEQVKNNPEWSPLPIH
ncbi:TPA: hypothetical protein RQN04_002030 [Aeromonas hydrophila]|nr:hypothetical protein [Aeromonas hydrophila]